jgi:hypothetical protein
MTHSTSGSRFRGAWLWAPVLVLAGMATLAFAQFGGAGAPAAKPKMEYLHQEVQSDAMVQTLNDLDGQGWELFQVVPVWSIRTDNGETSLAAKTYQVFGRRPRVN